MKSRFGALKSQISKLRKQMAKHEGLREAITGWARASCCQSEPSNNFRQECCRELIKIKTTWPELNSQSVP